MDLCISGTCICALESALVGSQILGISSEVRLRAYRSTRTIRISSFFMNLSTNCLICGNFSKVLLAICLKFSVLLNYFHGRKLFAETFR